MVLTLSVCVCVCVCVRSLLLKNKVYYDKLSIAADFSLLFQPTELSKVVSFMR